MTLYSLKSSSMRWLVFMGLMVGVFALTFEVERAVSIVLLAGMGLGYIGLLLYQGRVWFTRHYLQGGLPSVPLTHVLAVGGVYLMVASGYHFQPGPTRDTLPLAFLLLLAGGYVLGLALWLAPNTSGESSVIASAQIFHPVVSIPHRLLAGAGVIGLVLLAEANGQLLRTGLTLSTHMQFGLWAGGITLITVGLGGLTPRRPRLSQVGLPLLLILLLALGLRLWNLENSARFLVDELDFTGAIITLDSESERPLLKPVSDIGGFSLLFPYVQWHTVQIFGHNFTGLRIASTLIGTLHVAALYALARQLFDRPTALIAALLLATFPPHVHFSRLGLTELPGALCGTAGLAFLARAVMQGRRGDYVIAGGLLGMTHYFHEGGRLLYTPLALTWLAGWWWVGKARFSLRGVGWLVLTLVLVALPNYYALYGLGFPLTNRLATGNVAIDALYFDEIRASGEPVRLLRERVIDPMLLFVHATDGALFYLGLTGLVLPLLIPVFLVGLWMVIWRWRQPGMLLLLIWLAATIAGNSLLLVSTSVARYVIVFAGIALVLAVGLRVVSRLILPMAMLPRQPYYAVMTGLVVTLAAGQIYYYFGEHIPQYNWQARDLWAHPDAQDAAARAVDLPDGTAIHVVSSAPPATNYASGLLAFFTPHKDFSIDFLHPTDLNHDYLAALDVRRDHVFFIEPEAETALMETVQDYFYVLPPQYTPYPYIQPEAQFTLYHAPYIPGYSENRPIRNQPDAGDSTP